MHTTAGASAEVAAAASASLKSAVESAAASPAVVPGIDVPASADVPTASPTAQLHVDNGEVTSPAAAPGPGSVRTAAAGSDESRLQLSLTSTAVAPHELHGTVVVMEANSPAPADGATASDVTAAEDGAPSSLFASPGVASGDSESSSLAMASDLAATGLGICPEAADGQQLGIGTVQTHIQTAHVTLHGSSDTLETSAGDSTEDDLCGSTAADIEQVVPAGDLDAHMGIELADSLVTSNAEGAELAKYVATSDAELSEVMCWPSSHSGAAVEAAADLDTVDASMHVAAEDAATSPQAGSLHEEQPARQDAQPAKHDAQQAKHDAQPAQHDAQPAQHVEQPAESVAEHYSSVAPTAPTQSGPIVASEEVAAPGSAETLQETVHDLHTVAYAVDATEATAILSTPEFTDPVDQAEEALLPASPSTSLTTISAKQGSSVAPACSVASRAPVALQLPAMVGLKEPPAVAGMPNIRRAMQHMSCSTAAQVCVCAQSS